MDNSERFFANRDCRFYPCHESDGDINCLFCYCPLYFLEDCPGNYTFKERDGRKIKSCRDCLFPHIPENYDTITKILKTGIADCKI